MDLLVLLRIWNKRRTATDEGWSAGHLLPVRSVPAASREFTLLRESQVWYPWVAGPCLLCVILFKTVDGVWYIR